MRHALRLNLGSGNEPLAGWINIDVRAVPGVALLADARRLPFASGTASIVQASSLLEHFSDPYSVLDEIHRVLHPEGRLVARVPSPWSVWGALDTTHVFLADLRLWREILGGYFGRVRVRAEGARYRDSLTLRAATLALIRVLRWHELAETWVFECSERRPATRRPYVPWWLEGK